MIIVLKKEILQRHINGAGKKQDDPLYISLILGRLLGYK